MALAFYSDSALTTKITTLTTEHANTGEAVATQVFVSNDDATKTYKNIVIDVVDTDMSTDETSWVQLAPDNSGVAGTYEAGGIQLTMSDITDSKVAHAFWVKVTNPNVAGSQNKTDLELKLNFREYAV
jgi:hypothetical protein